MLGHVTHTALERLAQRFRGRKEQEQRSVEFQRQISHSKSQDSDEENHRYHPEQQRRREMSERRPLHDAEKDSRHHLQEQHSTTSTPASVVEQYAHSRKYVKPKEALLTKQQRRQQQRLKHMREQQEQQPEQRPPQAHEDIPKLHHRAWSAVPEPGHEEWQHWQHSLENESTDEDDKEQNRIV